MNGLGTLGGLGLPGAGALSPEQELMQGQHAMSDMDMQSFAQQLMANDPELAMQIMAGNVDPAMLAQLQGTGNDAGLMAMLGSAPSGLNPPADIASGMVAPPNDSLRNILAGPPPDMTQRPLDPTTIQRVAKALGLNVGDSGDPLSGMDPHHDPQGTEDYSLMQLLGGPGYVV